MDELKADLLDELKIELDVTDEKEIALLESKLKSAIREVKSYRGYGNTSMSDEDIENDLLNYASNIKSLAIFDFVQVGVEGQTEYTENGIGRTYRKRTECFNGINRFAKIL